MDHPISESTSVKTVCTNCSSEVELVVTKYPASQVPNSCNRCWKSFDGMDEIIKETRAKEWPDEAEGS